REAENAGVRSDCVVQLGGPQSGTALKQAVRVAEVDTGKTDKHGRPDILLLATDRLDLAAELVALAYRYRWAVELFFRWLKCILGCRPWLSESANGVAIQVYVALIASLLVVLGTGRKPNRRTWEMLQYYRIGWASVEEVERHLAGRPRPA